MVSRSIPHPLMVTYKKVKDLKPYSNNARTHSDEQINQIVTSINEFGFTNPLLIDEDGIIAGHGRLMAAHKIGMDEIPTITLHGLTKAQRQAYIIADNQLALNAGWNETLLRSEVLELLSMDFSVELLGFSSDFMADFMAEETEGLTDEDEVPEIEEKPVSKRGDIWILGDHHLMCGDSTSKDDVERLMDGHKADMVFTDPPYGIDEKGDRSKREGISKGGKFHDFKDDTIQYAIDAYNICRMLNIKRQIWWGANYYCHHLPQSNNWFIWDKRVEEKQKDTQSDCEMAWVKSEYSSVRIFRHLWKGLMKGSEHGQSRVHPTQKPIALAEWAFDYFKKVNSVLDLFGGSGSTLIACEKTNRKCYMVELDERYVDVIINRWQNYSGKDATLDGVCYNDLHG